MKKYLFVFSLLILSIGCSQECIDEVLENISSETIVDCTDEDVFAYSTGEAYPQSPMGFNGDSGEEIWWHGHLFPGCNLKFLEHNIEITSLLYLSRCEPHEVGNMDTWICDKVSVGSGFSMYYRANDNETFDGKTSVNVTCDCKPSVVLPDDFGDINDPLYLKMTPPTQSLRSEKPRHKQV